MKILWIIIVCVLVDLSSTAQSINTRSFLEQQMESTINNVDVKTEEYLRTIEENYAEFRTSLEHRAEELQASVNDAITEALQNATKRVAECISKHGVTASGVIQGTVANASSCALGKVTAILAEVRALAAAAEQARKWLESGLMDVEAGLNFISGSAKAIASLSVQVPAFRSNLEVCAASALAGAGFTIADSIAKIALCSVATT